MAMYPKPSSSKKSPSASRQTGGKAKEGMPKAKATSKSAGSDRTDKYGRTSFGVDVKGRSQGDNYVRGDMGANYMGRKSAAALKTEKEKKAANVVRSNKAQSARMTAQAKAASKKNK